MKKTKQKFKIYCSTTHEWIEVPKVYRIFKYGRHTFFVHRIYKEGGEWGEMFITSGKVGACIIESSAWTSKESMEKALEKLKSVPHKEIDKAFIEMRKRIKEDRAMLKANPDW